MKQAGDPRLGPVPNLTGCETFSSCRAASTIIALMGQNEHRSHSCKVLLEQLGHTLEVSGFDAEEVLRVSKGLAAVATNSPSQIMNYIDARQSSGATVSAQGHDMTLRQSAHALSDIDLSKLGEELRQLRVQLSRVAQTPDEDLALMNVVKAETAAADKDLSKTVEYLKRAGTWALEVATKIGTSVAGAAISHSLNLK